MNKPATKEPSMDEILSSIRQIIADDDASAAPPAPRSAPAVAPRPVVPPAPAAAAEPLALSPSQILRQAPAQMPAAPSREPAVPADFASMLSNVDQREDESEALAKMFAADPELVDPEDVEFEAEPEPAPVAPPPVARAPEPIPVAPPRPAAPVAQAAPMPDPTLSADLAEQLLAPATDAAVQANMSRLSAMSSAGIGGLTVEAMIRDMLRPMLKDWLDENLPSMVERMVEKEIARISRGVK